MSSLRNAAYRRNHHERPQPLARQKLGILEKKKDYIQRARNRRKKEDAIKKLREKARLRNKDEFYFSMINSKTKDGRHIATRNNNLPDETVKLIKVHHLNYINSKERSCSKKIESLRKSIIVTSSFKNQVADLDPVITGSSSDSRKHIVFKDSDSEIESDSLEPGVHDNSSSFTPTTDLSTDNDDQISLGSRHLRSLKGEFFKRIEIDNKLKKIQSEYQLRKNLNSKGARLVVGKDENGLNKYRWRQFRKK